MKTPKASRKSKSPEIVFPRACRLLKDIDEPGFRRLCECLNARELHLSNRETFIRESDPCASIGIVVMGAVRLTRQRVDGARNVLETVRENDTFGATYAFRDVEQMGISMSAVGDTVVLVFDIRNITRPCVKLCEEHLQFIRNLLTVMSQKTFQIKQKLRILSQRTIRGRLMLYLNICAKRAKSASFDIAFDRQALADFLCVERSALSAEISKLRAEGILESEKNHFTLKRLG